MPIEILMPALSPTMEVGNLAKWLKKEGETVEAGEVIAEIETDKATMEVEAVDEGTIGKIFVGEGAKDVAVNDVIAVLLADGEDKDVLKDYVLPEKPQAQQAQGNNASDGSLQEATSTQNAAPTISLNAAPTIAPRAATKAPQTSGSKAGGGSSIYDYSGIKASPVAKRIAQENSVDLKRVKATGPAGRIVKKDVEEFLQYGSVGSSGMVSRASEEFRTEENSTMRQVIAKRLLESKQQVPHFYLSVDCKLDGLLGIRKQLNDKAIEDANINNSNSNKANGNNTEAKPLYKLSVNDLIIKAVALSLKQVPAANASWYDDAIVLYNNVDVAVAVAIDGGLITPIIKNADQKTLPQISNEMKDLAKRAKANKLAPEEFQGGGFSISNLGMFGVDSFSAIINPPQSCILAVGQGAKKPIVNDNGEIEVATVMNVTLSVDHRSVDGAVGANFLKSFKKLIENPVLMLI